MNGNEWFIQCEKKARETNSLESFLKCVARVQKFGKISGYHWYRPLFQNDPIIIEWAAGGLYGGIVYHESENIWSVHT